MNITVDKYKREAHLPRGRGHSARENDDAFCNVLLLQDVEQPKGSRGENQNLWVSSQNMLRVHRLSHGLYPDTLFVGEEYKYLIRGICPGVGEEIQLVTTEASVVSNTLLGLRKKSRTQQSSHYLHTGS